jgi:hypothetical protein
MKNIELLGVVAHAYSHSYTRSGDRKDGGSRLAVAKKVSETPSQQKSQLTSVILATTQETEIRRIMV